MKYTGFASMLRDGTDYNATAFPDGSVDTYYTVHDSAGDRIDSRTAFGERIADGADAFSVEKEDTKPGGQAVNAAQQFHALGDSVQLFGHLDDPIFDTLDVETISMGAPASVAVYEFEDNDLMLADSGDASEWSFEELRTASDAFEIHLTANVVCCVNWASFDGMTDALSRLAALDFDGGPFVFDPGDLTGKPAEPVERLCATLGDLDNSYDVFVSADEDEIDYLASVLGVDTGDEAPLGRLREELAIAGVVSHGRPEATAATADGQATVETIEADGEKRQTGAGDRFSAGLAHGLAAAWDIEYALGLGNLCASYHVENGTTGTREELAEYAASETN